MLPVLHLCALAGLVLLLITRALLILLRKTNVDHKPQSCKTMIVLGSGGHTAEMIKLLNTLDKQHYSPRCYVVAATDPLSGRKAIAVEQAWQAETPTVHTIPRSREVGQSYLTSCYTTVYALLFSASLILRERPQLLLVNGPGTCIPLCASAVVLRVFGLLDTRVVYVESIARTRRLSLSAKILYHSRIVDLMFVQWQRLADSYPRAMYKGRLY